MRDLVFARGLLLLVDFLLLPGELVARSRACPSAVGGVDPLAKLLGVHVRRIGLDLLLDLPQLGSKLALLRVERLDLLLEFGSCAGSGVSTTGSFASSSR